MPRNLSPAARRAMFAQESDSVWCLLVTLSHPALAKPIRVVNDIVPADENGDMYVMSRGEKFVCYPFEVDLPADDGESVSQVSISIDNVDREIVDNLRAIKTPPTVALEVGLAESPDVIEAGPYTMSLVSAEYDALAITGELAFEPILSASAVSGRYTPAEYPGLF